MEVLVSLISSTFKQLTKKHVVNAVPLGSSEIPTATVAYTATSATDVMGYMVYTSNHRPIEFKYLPGSVGRGLIAGDTINVTLSLTYTGAFSDNIIFRFKRGKKE